MEAEAALGRREAVIERYERLCRDLDEQFGLEPSRNIRLLYRRLLGQDAEEHYRHEEAKRVNGGAGVAGHREAEEAALQVRPASRSAT